MRKSITKIMAFLTVSVMLVGTAISVAAEESVIDEIKTGSVTVQYTDDSEGLYPVAGAEFTLYKVADITQSDHNGAFLDSTYTSIIPGLYFGGDSAPGNGILVTIDTKPKEYIDLIHSYYSERNTGKNTSVTDANGKLVFPYVPVGAYVLEETRPNATHYASEPCLLSVPYSTGEAGSTYWEYDQFVTPKSVPTGQLTFSKQLKGNAIEEDKQFTFLPKLTIEDKAFDNVQYPYEKSSGESGMVAANGAIQLKGGESVTISMLPVGMQYELHEQEADTEGYHTVWSGEVTGHIERETEQKAVCTNTRNKTDIQNRNIQTGDISLYLAAAGVFLSAFVLFLIATRKKEKK